jgi:3-dehydroquinate synthase
VAHRGGSYPVVIRPGALAQLGALLAERHGGQRVVVISDATVAAAIPSPIDAERLTFPAGEHHKTRKSWAQLTDELITLRCGRDTVLVAMGGGVTTDLVGFVAATFLRGVPWIAVPTTTLAMVDAAVGGKTGVDTRLGKNLVGAVHHPSAVLVDPALLATLPERHYREGLAEAAKHAAILDAGYGDWLLSNVTEIAAREVGVMATLVQHSLTLKASVVAEDELEQGRRAILNAGHTVAHALEQVTNYALPHGEAVAIGLVLETRCAESAGRCAPGTAERVAELLHCLNLPTAPPAGLDASAVLAAMHHDKKNRAGVVRAALLSKFGATVRDGASWTSPLDLDVLRSLL